MADADLGARRRVVRRVVSGGSRTSSPLVACVGEVMAQVIPDHGASVADAESFVVRSAGAEFNVANGLVQLGSRAAMVTRLGDDAIGDRVWRDLEASGVVMSHVQRRDGARTGLFVKDPRPDGSRVTYYREQSAASQIAVEDVEDALSLRPTVLHVSGVTPALSESCLEATRHALEGATRVGTTGSFDVNYRPALWSSRRQAADVLRDLAAKAQVVFVGLDEAHSLWGTSTPQQVSDLLPRVQNVIVKDGEQDARSYHGGVVTVVPALQVDVVEPVGAGDAFAAGWLHGLMCELPEESRLRLGHLVARSSLQSFTDHASSPLDAGLLVDQATAAPWPVPSVPLRRGEKTS